MNIEHTNTELIADLTELENAWGRTIFPTIYSRIQIHTNACRGHKDGDKCIFGPLKNEVFALQIVRHIFTIYICISNSIKMPIGLAYKVLNVLYGTTSSSTQYPHHRIISFIRFRFYCWIQNMYNIIMTARYIYIKWKIIWKSAIKIIKLQLYIRMSAWMFITILPVSTRILNSELWTFSFAHHAKCTSILNCKWPARLWSAWTYVFSNIFVHRKRPKVRDRARQNKGLHSRSYAHSKCCPVNSFMVFTEFWLRLNYLNSE